MSRLELMTSIRETLRVPLTGTADTISHEPMRLLVAALERLNEEELTPVLAVSRKAKELDSVEVQAGPHRNHTNPGMCRDEWCIGEDVRMMRVYLKYGLLDQVLALATVIDDLPDGMRVRAAIETLNALTIERFSIDAAEQVTAHLYVAHEMAKDRRGYHPDIMLLVHVHPDKAKTIATLSTQQRDSRPTNREVLDHHGIEPVLYGGIL